MDALIAALHVAVSHRVVVMMTLMAVVIAVMAIANPRGVKTRVALALLALIAVGNSFAGDRVLGWWLDRHGMEGVGTIVAAHETSSRINGRYVKRYDALIRTADGRIVETGFDGFALPLYPAPGDGFAFPATGVQFRVRYLPSYPHVFSIRSDGDSAYARGLDCAALARAMNEARERQRFDPASTDYRLAHARAMTAHADAGCNASGGAASRAGTRSADAR